MASYPTAAAIFGLLCTHALAAPQNVPPRMSGDPQVLGHTFDPGFGQGNASNPNDPGYYSDGGAGGLVNGYHMLTLSDARVLERGGLTHTVYAFTDADSPTNITIIGDYETEPHFFLQGNGDGQGVVRSDSSDACDGPSFAPAPNTMMVPLEDGSTTGLNVWSVYCGTVQYNTLIEWDVQNLEGLVASNQNIPNTRTVDRLFNASQPLYGTDGFAVDDTYIYLVARNDAAFKLARVEKDKRTDITQYKYYYPGANVWNSTIPNVNDTSPDVNFFTGTNPGNGVQFGSDLFFSPYFNTWMLSYSSFGFTGLYSLAYSTSGNVEGPYSDVSGFYSPPLDPGCDSSSPEYVPASNGSVPVAYLMHSHPGYDTTGKTMVIGWISCNTFTNFARVTFQ